MNEYHQYAMIIGALFLYVINTQRYVVSSHDLLTPMMSCNKECDLIV